MLLQRNCWANNHKDHKGHKEYKKFSFVHFVSFVVKLDWSVGGRHARSGVFGS